MPLGAVSICQVSNQLSGKLVNVHASEVIELLSLEVEDGRAKDDRYEDATAVEYFSVHDLPPVGGAPLRQLALPDLARQRQRLADRGALMVRIYRFPP